MSEQEKLSIIVFSGELDKALATMNIATGAAASGMEVTLFFTFWGVSMLKKKGPKKGASTILGKMFDKMLPGGPDKLPLSNLNMGGMGSKMMRKQMKSKKVQSLPEFLELAQELDIKMVACTMSMDVMEIPKEDLIDGIEYGGVAAFLNEASESKFSLFI
ncbi:DsrE/DsrF/DrsH-like family protein [Metallumcola ferriviriculae]|uniref:DsrE/DsrF/DrsH-like family protein n=1 Tax=Metallumcola ferriviriculae TaxID=3039180 RepID=A0AAU0USM6_9FIRM|nr:DsrE/DsrF/DrsH-like family protein [Desulfitibacteraceae bacterium MK1]